MTIRQHISHFTIYIAKHKLKSAIAGSIVLVILFFVVKPGSSSGETRYVLRAAEKGTIVSSIMGSGQVSASTQIDIKSKVSGNIIFLNAEEGKTVQTGILIAELDARNATKTIRDAEISLESAKLQLEKLRGPEGLQIPKNKEQAEEDLKRAYDDGFNTISNAFLDLPTVMTGLQDIIYGSTISPGQWNADYFTVSVQNYDTTVIQFRDDTYAKYNATRKQYDQTFLNYKAASRFSDTNTIETLLTKTYDTTKTIADAIKSANNLIQFYKDKLTEHNLKTSSFADTYLANLNTYTGKTNTHLLSLSNVKNVIQNNKDASENADLDIRSQAITIKQRENALLDAKEALADYFIRAPFNGVIAKINIKKLDSVSPSTILATLITKQKIAEISMNEVDVTRIAVGQKATLTFDAIDELNVSGKVVSIDAIGTISQGVVTYTVKIAFDTDDTRVKPGMSVSAAIITNVTQDVLMVPASAIKTQGDIHYVEILDHVVEQPNAQGIISATPPQQKIVEIGVSNDTQTEIISGLNAGDQVITRTIAPPSKTQTTAAPNLFGSPGGTRSTGGSGAIRIRQ